MMRMGEVQSSMFKVQGKLKWPSSNAGWDRAHSSELGALSFELPLSLSFEF
jgi:hypothetical protein